jgi:hypothetical protein
MLLQTLLPDFDRYVYYTRAYKKRPLYRKGKELRNRSVSSSKLGLTNLRVQQWKPEGVEEMQRDNIHIG